MKLPMPLILRGDARKLPLPAASVDLIVTSPPYFGLRSYQDGGEHYDGQLGAEATPSEFIAALVECTREWVRVLKPSGSLFVNLGDKYNSAASGQQNGNGHKSGLGGGRHDRMMGRGTTVRAVPQKSLMLLPERYRIACTDELGLIARAVLVWSKPNCLSGGTTVYAKVQGRPTSIKVHDLCRHYQPEDVQLWNGQRWTQVVWWQPTEPAPGRAASSQARRTARYRGLPLPPIEGDIEIELRSGERIGCTREHRWPTRRGLVQASDLVVGDVLDTAPLPEGDVAPAALDDEMVGWFVGLYIAEGSRSEQTIQIAGHVNELERFKRLSEIAEAFHGTARVHATGGNTATINLTGNMLRAILDTYVGGRTAKDKFLAPKCWQRSNRFLRAVLDGYLSGDGHRDVKANRWVLGFTDNDALAADLRTLGARLGLSVRLKRVTHTGFGKEWPGWGGTIVEQHRRRQPDSEIVEIRQSRARQFWDIGVEDDPHLFSLASGVLTHNSLPESVTDRVRRSHEDWVHLTRSPKYYAAVDEIRDPATERTLREQHLDGQVGRAYRVRQNGGGGNAGSSSRGNPLGRLPGSVWEIATQPLRVPAELGVQHFAAFPMEIPRRLILGWSPREVCTACGEGRRPVAERASMERHNGGQHNLKRYSPDNKHGYGASTLSVKPDYRITGHVCACPDTTAPSTPGVVLDPFGGTGTTALVATMCDRRGISIDLSGDYCRLAQWRSADPKERARAAGLDPDAVAATRPQLPGQYDLFEGGAA